MVTGSWRSGTHWLPVLRGHVHRYPSARLVLAACAASSGRGQSGSRGISSQQKRLASSTARGSRAKKVTLKLSDLPQGRLAPPPANDTAAAPPLSAPDSIDASANANADADATTTVKVGPTSRRLRALRSRKKKAAEEQESKDAAPNYPTVILQAYHNMQRLANCVVLTRVGGFYELYLYQADEFGPLMNLKVSQRRTSEGFVSMAGFPFFQLERYLKTLVQDLNRHVAIVEEFPKSEAERARTGIMHDRKVARIVTPGTLIDEAFIDPYSSNYAMAIHVATPCSTTVPSTGASTSAPTGADETSTSDEPDLASEPNPNPNPTSTSTPSHVPNPAAANIVASSLSALSSTPLGIAWLDLSTGHFFTQSTDLASLSSILSRVSPREIVLDRALAPAGSAFALLSSSSANATASTAKAAAPTPISTSATTPLIDAIHAVLAEDRNLVSYAESDHFLDLKSWDSMLETPIPDVTARAFTSSEINAGSLLLRYVGDRLQGSSIKLQAPQRRESIQVMTIDRNTLKSLEIKLTMRDGALKGSLLHTVRRTVTRSGARLLCDWLTSPSIDLTVIKGRQDLVSVFLKDGDLRDTIILLLKRTHDSQRVAQKFALGRGKADDLLDLATTILNANEIARHLRAGAAKIPDVEAECIATLLGRTDLDGPLKLAKQILNAIDQDGLFHQNELEESAASQMIALAHQVVNAEGTATDVADLPRAITDSASSPAVATAKKKARGTSSLRDAYGEDNEVWVMKPTANSTLKTLHAELARLKAQKDTLEENLRARYAAPSLTLKWGLGLGHVCHIKGKDAFAAAAAANAPPSTSDPGASSPRIDDLLSTNILRASRTTRTFHLPEWTDLGTQLDQARQSIRAEEKRVFVNLRAKVVANLVKLRRNAEVLDEIDITTSFAVLADAQGLVRPRLDASLTTDIRGGRHPTVEAGLRDNGRSFSRNDCVLGGPGHGRVWLVTGPNMAGKSTFLRQNALLAVLAQVGCFVPAMSAHMGLVDAIFSRVGSADNLYRDQSTFMVEMLETAQILRTATARSFVIMDEIGRGTTPVDGVAVAYASLKHLVLVNRCRTLFATHFHDVADMAMADGLMLNDDGDGDGDGDGETGAVETYCTDVEENPLDGSFVYVHKLRKGVNRKSHALKVAELAGLPPLAIETAQAILDKMP